MVALLVSSCDTYQACWPAFVHGLRKYWPDQPWPIKFITNYRDAPIGTTLWGDSIVNWSDRMLLILEQVEESVVLLMMEDYWLTHKVDTKALEEFAALFASNDIDYIRLRQNGKTLAKQSYKTDDRLFITSDAEVYRAALQAAFWRVSTLKRLIKPHETVQQFEIQGSLRSRGTDRMLCVRESKYIQYVDSAVRAGNWTQAGIEYAAREGLKINFWSELGRK